MKIKHLKIDSDKTIDTSLVTTIDEFNKRCKILGESSVLIETKTIAEHNNSGIQGSLFESFFGVTANNETAPDLKSLGIELKTTNCVSDLTLFKKNADELMTISVDDDVVFDDVNNKLNYKNAQWDIKRLWSHCGTKLEKCCVSTYNVFESNRKYKKLHFNSFILYKGLNFDKFLQALQHGYVKIKKSDGSYSFNCSYKQIGMLYDEHEIISSSSYTRHRNLSTELKLTKSDSGLDVTIKDVISLDSIIIGYEKAINKELSDVYDGSPIYYDEESLFDFVSKKKLACNKQDYSSCSKVYITPTLLEKLTLQWETDSTNLDSLNGKINIVIPDQQSERNRWKKQNAVRYKFNVLLGRTGFTSEAACYIDDSNIDSIILEIGDNMHRTIMAKSLIGTLSDRIDTHRELSDMMKVSSLETHVKKLSGGVIGDFEDVDQMKKSKLSFRKQKEYSEAKLLIENLQKEKSVSFIPLTYLLEHSDLYPTLLRNILSPVELELKFQRKYDYLEDIRLRNDTMNPWSKRQQYQTFLTNEGGDVSNIISHSSVGDIRYNSNFYHLFLNKESCILRSMKIGEAGTNNCELPMAELFFIYKSKFPNLKQGNGHTAGFSSFYKDTFGFTINTDSDLFGCRLHESLTNVSLDDANEIRKDFYSILEIFNKERFHFVKLKQSYDVMLKEVDTYLNSNETKYNKGIGNLNDYFVLNNHDKLVYFMAYAHGTLNCKIGVSELAYLMINWIIRYYDDNFKLNSTDDIATKMESIENLHINNLLLCEKSHGSRAPTVDEFVKYGIEYISHNKKDPNLTTKVTESISVQITNIINNIFFD